MAAAVDRTISSSWESLSKDRGISRTATQAVSLQTAFLLRLRPTSNSTCTPRSPWKELSAAEHNQELQALLRKQRRAGH